MCHMCHCRTNAPFRNLHYLLSSITTYTTRKRQHHRTNSSPCPWKCYAKTKFLYLIQAKPPPQGYTRTAQADPSYSRGRGGCGRGDGALESCLGDRYSCPSVPTI